MKEFCLSITFECNWDCEYCVATTHEKEKIQEEELLKTVNMIDNNMAVTLTGGEPGLIKKELLDKIIIILLDKKCRIDVVTNGLFLKKFPEYYDTVEDYLYHVSIDMETPGDIIDFYNPKDKIDYMVVVTDKNMDNLEDYLNATDKYIQIHGAYTLPGKIGLSKFNTLKLIQKYKNYIKKEDLKFLISTYHERGEEVDI
ncbi:MAG: hypothetical protein DRG78_18055 [Epsilonproteobacteria bacterium]|nr:MAG: hypothetical protein DRG78_18055 [Campylobacterota bacterium]